MSDERRVIANLYSDGSWEWREDYAPPPPPPPDDGVRPGILEVALLSSPNPIENASVSDDTGEVVWSTNHLPVGAVHVLENLPSGAYIVEAWSTDGVDTNDFRQVVPVLPGGHSSVNISMSPRFATRPR